MEQLLDKAVDLGVAIVGALVAIPILTFLIFGRRALYLRYRLADTLARAGMRRFSLHRDDYRAQAGRSLSLRSYLETAADSIEIISISMNVTQAEHSLIELFLERIRSRPNFTVRVSLLNPESPAVGGIAGGLLSKPSELADAITDMLRQLTDARDTLAPADQHRLAILVHNTLTFGSAILLDATKDRGAIQVETKLYKAPRSESFGFEVVGPSPFYTRNFTAWHEVLRDSTPWSPPPPQTEEVLALPPAIVAPKPTSRRRRTP